ncbi:MAG: hypothetical protein OIN87_00030 [Candidatus Methanoperedens sp.]|nr:hypothetical protein [Candidatus Methanoperedens sp.]
MVQIKDKSIDVVFTSNFFEHLCKEDIVKTIIPGVSMNGVFLSQYLNDINDLASVFSGYITQDITEMTINVDNPAYYMKNIKVKFVGIPANITVQNNSYSPMPDWRSLKQVKGGIMWIDTIGNNQYAQANGWLVDTKKEQYIRISGWAADDSIKNGEIKKFLVLNGGNDPIVLPTRKKFRPDVADYFGIENYIQSGWEATIRSKGLTDCFNISIRILRSNGEEYYELDGGKPICFR